MFTDGEAGVNLYYPSAAKYNLHVFQGKEEFLA